MNILKEEMERLAQEHLRERNELERINTEAIEQIKTEIDYICEGKTEQEREV